MQHWIYKLHELLDTGVEQSVLVTIAKVQGSAPREAGAKMVVTDSQIYGTIGGGNLEFTAIDQSRAMLLDADRAPLITRQFSLGPSLGQCCGGRVVLSFEMITSADEQWIDQVKTYYETKEPCVVVTGTDRARTKTLITSSSSNFPAWITPELSTAAMALLNGEDFYVCHGLSTGDSKSIAYTLDKIVDNLRELWLFGAGHVGRAIADVMNETPFRIMWVDSRSEEFSDLLPPNVSIVISDEPQFDVVDAESGAYFLVMTHSHQLDEDICRAVLKREDFGFLGVIGSNSKKARFLHRLRDRGISEKLLSRIICPIGLPTISSKKPRDIAISVAAQLLSLVSEEAVQKSEYETVAAIQ
jgi:xanthine dehydrogenase accessory factor